MPVEPVSGAAHTVRVFAQRLAAAGVPAGFIIGKADARPVGAPKRAHGQHATVPVARALALFEQHHPDYRGVEKMGALLVEPRPSSACASALGALLTNFRFDGAVYEAAFEIDNRLRSEKRSGPPGLVGARLDSLYRSNVSLNVAHGTVMDVLFEIVRQVPGLVWAIVETLPEGERPGQCELRWYLADDTVFTDFDIWPEIR